MLHPFFDIYRSPLATFFGRRWLSKECTIDWHEELEINISGYKTLIQTWKDRDGSIYIQYLAFIQDDSVEMVFSGNKNEVYVNFQINDSFEKSEETGNKIAIIKWLIKVWELEKINHSKCLCVPYGGHNGFRAEYYKRFGFKFINGQEVMKYNF